MHCTSCDAFQPEDIKIKCYYCGSKKLEVVEDTIDVDDGDADYDDVDDDDLVDVRDILKQAFPDHGRTLSPQAGRDYVEELGKQILEAHRQMENDDVLPTE